MGINTESKNLHPFANKTVFFPTKHGKEEILKPLLLEIGIQCKPILIDTDRFGTFSGEVERQGSVKDTLRKKIYAAAENLPNEKLFLASEGSFGPHPIVGFLKTDLESLLLWNKELNIEIYAEHLSTNPVHTNRTLGPRDDFRAFLKEIFFPEHGVIVHPENSINPIFKGLHEERTVAQAILDSFMTGNTGRVVIETDLRANHNPTRRLAIAEAGKNLIEKLKSFCPACNLPGFGIEKGLQGLPCFACGLPSEATKSVVLGCVKCKHKEEKPRPDGKINIDPSECNYCNP